MKITKSFLLFLLCLSTNGMQARFWNALNHRLAALNFRSSHAGQHLPEDENDKSLFSKIQTCFLSADDGKILSLRDVGILKRLAKKKDHKNFADRILLKNRLNVVRAAREVKCIVIALITSVILYKNRELLGKKWENIKDIISGIAIVWICYTFRHQLANGVSAVTGALRSSASD